MCCKVGVQVYSFVWEYPVIQGLSLFFVVLILIGVYLLYNVVLVSAVQQITLHIHVCKYIYANQLYIHI